MATRQDILDRLKALQAEGGLSPEMTAKVDAALGAEATAVAAEDPQTNAEVAQDAASNGFDPVRAVINTVSGDDVLRDAAMHDGERSFDKVDERVAGLRALPELQNIRVGGDHQISTGRKFLEAIDFVGMEGDDKTLNDLTKRLDSITAASGSFDDPKSLRKMIDTTLANYNVETEQVGDAILMNFDDPLTGERHVAWSNKPGFSGRDAMSLMGGAADAATTFLGVGGLIKGPRLAREVVKRRAARRKLPVRDPVTGRMGRNPKGVADEARAAAKAEKQAAKQAKADAKAAGEPAPKPSGSTAGKPKSGLRTAAQLAAEETAFSLAGLPGSAMATKLLTGKTPIEVGQAGIRAVSKIKRRDRALKMQRK